MALYGCNVFPFAWVGDFVYVQQLYAVQDGILRHFEPETPSSHVKYSHKKKCCGIKVHYLEFSFLYLIVLPICIVAALYFMHIKNLREGSLYMALWAVFCTTFTLYGITNLIYTNAQNETFSFTSEIESVAASGYRSPSSISFKLNSGVVSIVVTNEYLIKNKLNKGAQVMISGNYKKGLLSSVMIKNYSID